MFQNPSVHSKNPSQSRGTATCLSCDDFDFMLQRKGCSMSSQECTGELGQKASANSLVTVQNKHLKENNTSANINRLSNVFNWNKWRESFGSWSFLTSSEGTSQSVMYSVNEDVKSRQKGKINLESVDGKPLSHDLFTYSRQCSWPHTTTLTVSAHLFPPSALRHLGMWVNHMHC